MLKNQNGKMKQNLNDNKSVLFSFNAQPANNQENLK